MRIDIDHARTLAHDLLRLHIPPATAAVTQGTEGLDFHRAVAKALATYTDNAEALTWTAHRMGDSALHTLAAVEVAEGALSTDLTRITGGLT